MTEFVNAVGCIASGLVFATFFMRSPLRLRHVAIASNVAFIAYGALGHLFPVLLLHVLLLPLNVIRLVQLRNDSSGTISLRPRTARGNGRESGRTATEIAPSHELTRGTLATTIGGPRVLSAVLPDLSRAGVVSHRL